MYNLSRYLVCFLNFIDKSEPRGASDYITYRINAIPSICCLFAPPADYQFRLKRSIETDRFTDQDCFSVEERNGRYIIYSEMDRHKKRYSKLVCAFQGFLIISARRRLNNRCRWIEMIL